MLQQRQVYKIKDSLEIRGAGTLFTHLLPGSSVSLSSSSPASMNVHLTTNSQIKALIQITVKSEMNAGLVQANASWVKNTGERWHACTRLNACVFLQCKLKQECLNERLTPVKYNPSPVSKKSGPQTVCAAN